MSNMKYWQQNAVYQIYPRSFCDSNGDGIGDIPGIISKLDYLKELGIHIVWLSPVYKSPMDDMGYDIADYMEIQPEYGTMEDMERLILEAKKRDIRIVMDLVVNHTSDEHKWFIESKKKDSPYHDYYYWRDGKKNNTLPPNNWTGMFPGCAWEFVPEVGQWYLHLYSKKQPDLNWHNPKVYEEVTNILRFWLDKGIYGFRCDVINQIYKESLEDGKGHSPSARGIEHYLMTEGNHQILKRFQEDVFSHYDCVVIGETYNVDVPNGIRFLDGEMNMFFNFDHMGVDKPTTPFSIPKFAPAKFMAQIIKWQEGVDWNANYIANHDQRRPISRFGDPKHFWKESGKMLCLMNLTLRGTPFVYEGEELGMLDIPPEKPGEFRDVSCNNIYNTLLSYKIFTKRSCERFINAYNRDHARSPMQWDTSDNAGFSNKGVTCWIDVNRNYPAVNAEVESRDENSIYHFYKKMIEIRQNSDVLALGSFKLIYKSKYIFAWEREYEGKKTLSVINFSNKKRRIPKILSGYAGEVIISNYKDRVAVLRPYEATLVSI